MLGASVSLRMKSLMLTVIAIILCAVAAADTHHVISDDWYAHESRHFNMVTNLPQTDAQQLVVALEQFHTAASQWMGLRSFPQPERCEILALDSHESMVAIFGTERYSGFMRSSLRGTQLVFAPDATGDHLVENAQHEYAHFLLRRSSANALPRWYEEGNASFLASMTVKARSATVGGATKYDGRAPGRRQVDTNLAALIGTTTLSDLPEEALAMFYRDTWRLVHMLHLGHLAGGLDRRATLARYLRSIASGEPETGSFARHFSSLEDAFTRYRRRTRLPRQTFKLDQEPDTAITESEKISASTVAWILGNAAFELNPQFGQPAFEWLLKQPQSERIAHTGLALLAQHQKNYDAAALYALKALATSNGQPAERTGQLARVVLADAMIERCRDASSCRSEWQGAVRLYRSALDAEPGRLDALFGLGVAQMKLSDLEQAVSTLEQAHENTPWTPRISLYLGEAYRLSGRRTAARQQLTRALRWEEDAFWRERAKEALSLLDSELHDVPVTPMP